jgi:DinB superfamily
MKELSEQLLRVVETAEAKLRKTSEPETSKPIRPGGWSRKQVLGHLIDSASNTHQRFVRAALQPSLDFPPYDQDGNVRLEAPQEADWSLLVSLWAAYNRYLAHIIARLPANKLETVCRIGPDKPFTLEFLANDYVRHLVHHLNQIGAGNSK